MGLFVAVVAVGIRVAVVCCVCCPPCCWCGCGPPSVVTFAVLMFAVAVAVAAVLGN